MIHRCPHRSLRRLFRRLQYTHGISSSAAHQHRGRRARPEAHDPDRLARLHVRPRRFRVGREEASASSGSRRAMEKGPAAVDRKRARRVVGDGPTYVSFDDMLDPAYAPGALHAEIGAHDVPGSSDAARDARAAASPWRRRGGSLAALRSVGRTAHAGVTMMFEILCPMAEDVAKRRRT
ncbi:MAG: hypothetical protein U1E16_04650 [Hyphomicrobiales bacterium]